VNFTNTDYTELIIILKNRLDGINKLIKKLISSSAYSIEIFDKINDLSDLDKEF
jgi:hypothetical protein